MIHTLTLNPAVDKILYVDEFKRNITTRINRVVETIGGKGTHVSVNLVQMGAQNHAFGIAHGPTGEQVISMLRKEGVEVQFLLYDKPAVGQVHTGRNTRTNYLLAEGTGDSTLITEKGVQLTRQDLQDVLDIMQENVQPGDFMALSGDASNYEDPYVYNYVMQELKDAGLKFFLDTSGKSLKECVKAQPFLIKPNLDELSLLVGRDVAERQDDVVDAIHMLDEYKIEVVAVSLGGSGSIVKYRDGIYRAVAAQVNVKNTVGCGDCYLAGMLYGFHSGMEFEDILRYATAAGGAAAECELSVGLSAERARQLMEQIRIERIV